MKISIHAPLGFSEKGRRNTNQDSMAPALADVSEETALFIVCDGVGGAADGEKASSMAATGFYQFLKDKVSNEQLVGEALRKVQEEIDLYLKSRQTSKGMGTTLALLQLNKNGAFVAHIGDSRVYQIREGRVIFCTEDHSLINAYKKQGIKDAHLAKSNVITRAIQGGSVKAVNADTTQIRDVRENDYFLLCSDGVWGSFSEAFLMSVLNAASTDEEKMNIISERCQTESNDNYSAYLIRISGVQQEEGSEEVSVSSDESYPPLIHVYEEPSSYGSLVDKSWLWGTLLFVLTTAGYLYFSDTGQEKKGAPKVNTMDSRDSVLTVDTTATKKSD